MKTEAEPSIVDKIRKLLRLSDTAKGATTAEAEQAMAMAQKLMTKYGIDHMTVMSKEAESDKPSFELEKRYFYVNRPRYPGDQYIATIIRLCFGVRVLWASDYKFIDSPKKYSDGSPRQVLKQRLVYVLVGDKTDIDVAQVIIEELHKTMRHLLHKYIRSEGIPWSGVVCHSFFQGLEDGYIEANKKGKAEALLEAGDKVANQYALVLVSKEEAVKEFYQKIPTVRSRCLSGGRSWITDPDAKQAGYEKGKKLNLGSKRLGEGSNKLT